MPRSRQALTIFQRTAVLAAGVAVALSVGCSGEGTTGKILRVGLQDDLKSLDPVIGYDVPSWSAEHLLYNGLVTYDLASQVIPDLATGWQMVDGGKAYVFTLRPGLHFHDGRPVTARDVAFSFDRLLDPASKSPGASFYADIVGATARLAGGKGPLKGVVATGDLTVRIDLVKPNPVFLQLLAMPFTSIVPTGTVSADLARKPIGTGPYVFSEWVSGERMVFKRNQAYFAPNVATLDGVEYQLGLNENLEVLKFERGELDLLGANRNIPAADFARLSQDAKLKPRMLSAPDAAFHYVGMNCSLPPFDKIAVRQAIAMAIDKKRIVQLVNGRGQVAIGILPPTMPGYNAALQGLPFDPDRAKSLLATAGFRTGFTATYYCVSNDTARKIAQSIQQDLGKIGITLQLKPLAFPTFLEAKATRGQVGIASGNWSQDFPDPSNFLTTMFHSKNIKVTNSLNDSYYRNAKVDEWLDRADASTDAAIRTESFREAEKLITADSPVVPLYNPVKYHLRGERVHGYKLHPIWGMELAGVTIE